MTPVSSQLGGASSGKKQSSDWSSSGWDADDSWSNEKEADSQGQTSPAEEGWGNDWEEDGGGGGGGGGLGGLGDSFIPTARDGSASALAPKSAESCGQDGVRLASEYNWESAGGKGGPQNDIFTGMSQRTAPTVRRGGDGVFKECELGKCCTAEFVLVRGCVFLELSARIVAKLEKIMGRLRMWLKGP